MNRKKIGLLTVVMLCLTLSACKKDIEYSANTTGGTEVIQDEMIEPTTEATVYTIPEMERVMPEDNNTSEMAEETTTEYKTEENNDVEPREPLSEPNNMQNDDRTEVVQQPQEGETIPEHTIVVTDNGIGGENELLDRV